MVPRGAVNAQDVTLSPADDRPSSYDAAVDDFTRQYPKLARQRDDAVVDPIRLGGRKVRSTTQVDANGEEHQFDCPEPAQELKAAVDWDGISRSAGLDAFENRVFRAHWRHRTPIADLHTSLKCKPADAQRALQSVREKLSATDLTIAARSVSLEPAPHSRRLTARETFYSGVRVTSPAKLDQIFLAIMHDEKYRLLFQRDEIHHTTRIPSLSQLIRRRMNDIEISPEALANEMTVKAGMFPNREQALKEFCQDVIRTRMIREHEEAERAALSALTDAEIRDQLNAAYARVPALRDAVEADQKKMAKARAKYPKAHGEGDVVRAVLATLKTGVPEIESDLRRHTEALYTELRLITLLREQDDYRASVARSHQAADISSNLSDAINKAVKQVSATHPNLHTLPINSLFPEVANCLDQTERFKVIAVFSAMLDLDAYRKWRETVTTKGDAA